MATSQCSKPALEGLGKLGPEQLQWLEADLKAQPASRPVVVFAHIPLWSVYPDWGWGTEDSAQARKPSSTDAHEGDFLSMSETFCWTFVELGFGFGGGNCNPITKLRVVLDLDIRGNTLKG